MGNQNYGTYYLQETGALIWRLYEPSNQSLTPECRRVWQVDLEDRDGAWTILLESLALGGAIDRLRKLAGMWNCRPRELAMFMIYKTDGSELQKRGAELYLSEIAHADPAAWFRWLSEIPAGASVPWETMPEAQAQ